METEMGVILQFRQLTEPVPRTAEPEGRAIGQVVIFPGVRIERHVSEDAPARTAGPARKRAQRARKKQS